MGYVSIRVRDYSREYSTFSIPVDDFEPATDTFAQANTLVDNIVAAVDPLILGSIVSASYSQTLNPGVGDVAPASGEAQREKGFRFFYTSSTNEHGSFTLPTADFGTYALEGKDELDMADAAVAALIALVEANVEINGNAVTVDRVKLVGRNS